jgi:hypothetical protein
MLWEGANRLRAGRYSRHRPDGESRRVPDDRMLWKGTAQMRCAHFPTINSVLSIATEPRRQSRHIVGVPMEKRPPMTEHEVAPEHPNLNEGYDQSQGGTSRTPTAIGPVVADFKDGSPTELQRLGVAGRLSSPGMDRTDLMMGDGANRLRA